MGNFYVSVDQLALPARFGHGRSRDVRARNSTRFVRTCRWCEGDVQRFVRFGRARLFECAPRQCVDSPFRHQSDAFSHGRVWFVCFVDDCDDISRVAHHQKRTRAATTANAANLGANCEAPGFCDVFRHLHCLILRVVCVFIDLILRVYQAFWFLSAKLWLGDVGYVFLLFDGYFFVPALAGAFGYGQNHANSWVVDFYRWHSPCDLGVGRCRSPFSSHAAVLPHVHRSRDSSTLWSNRRDCPICARCRNGVRVERFFDDVVCVFNQFVVELFANHLTHCGYAAVGLHHGLLGTGAGRRRLDGSAKVCLEMT